MMRELIWAILAANLALGAAVALVMPLRPPVRRRFGARAAYALWIVAPVAALAAAIPHRGAAGNALPAFVAQAGAAAKALPTSGAAQDGLAAALIALWAAGAVAAAFLLAWRQRAFERALGALSPLPGEPRVVRAARADAGPALVGVLRPRIVTPADFETRFAPDERALILAHERTHLAGGDALANAAACAIACLGWFNPLAWAGAAAMRRDQELACDAEVLAAYPQARRLYCEILLKTQLAREALPLGCHWPPGAEHPLKERIAMLKSPLPGRAARRAGLAMAALAGAAAASGAWSASARAPHAVTKPDWADKPVPADLVDAYPPEAAKAGLGGRATIDCAVAADGLLARCTVLREDPPGAGFGEAALKLSQRFRMKPMSRDGRPVAGGTVRIPIMFRIPRPPSPPAG